MIKMKEVRRWKKKKVKKEGKTKKIVREKIIKKIGSSRIKYFSLSILIDVCT